ncbi:MAG TPA: hypothetical protein VFI30_07015 [Nocardioidaceae bacterium]|nr:hypothetical protein [Nocardioidaceae bacterium]
MPGQRPVRPANAGQSDGATLTASSKKLGSASVNLTGASTAAACTGVPVAVLDPSQGDVGYPTQVFNGANSYDPCGRPLLYGWDCLSTYDQQECSVINSDPSSPTETWTDTTLGDQITLGLIVCVVDPNATDGYPTPLSHPGYECSDEAGPYQYNAVVTTA